MNPSRLVLAVVFLASTQAGAVTRASPALRDPSPLAFLVHPEASWRWRFSLRNQSTAPVSVIADRRLISIEFPPEGTATRRRGRGRRCVHSARPALNEFAPRVTLAPGEQYSELFDLRDLCALRVPSHVEGGQARLRYGWDDSRRLSISRSLMIDEGPSVLPSLETVVTLPAPMAAPVESPGGAALRARASGGQASQGSGLRVTVGLENPSVQPIWTLYRHGMWSFEVLTPEGQSVTCDLLTRAPSPRPDYFLRLAGRGRTSVSLTPGAWCPSGTFDHAGVYDLRAVFQSNAGGEEWGLQRVFTGRISTSVFSVRVSRGDGRYYPSAAVQAP